MKRWQVPLVISVVVAVALYLVGMVATDMKATEASLAKMGLLSWLLVLGFSIFNYALRFVRWADYIKRISHVSIKPARHFAYYVSGFALSTTPGKAGEAIRSLYLHNHGVGYHQSISALFVERLLDLMSIALLAVVACAYFPNYRWVAVLAILGVIFALFMLHQTWALDWLEVHADRFGKLQKPLRHVVTMLRNAMLLLRNRQLLAGLLLGVLAWGSEGIGFYVTLQVMGVAIDPWLAISIYGVAVLVGALSFLPGGLGGTEAVMALLLVAAGADKPTALAATLVCRIATLWFAVGIGLATMGVLALNPAHKKLVKNEVA